jgi:hypothetical protein
MLDTFKARLKAKSKASGANLSQKRIDAIADRLNAKFPDLTEEADHDAKLDDLYDESDFKEMASFDDHQRKKDAFAKKDTQRQQKQQQNTDATNDDDSSNNQQSGADDMPAWFKTYKEETEAKLNGFLKEKQQATIQQKLAEKLKDTPNPFWQKRKLPETDEEVDAFVEEVQTDWTAFSKDHVKVDSAKTGHRPVRATSAGDKGPDAKELDSIYAKV